MILDVIDYSKIVGNLTLAANASTIAVLAMQEGRVLRVLRPFVLEVAIAAITARPITLLPVLIRGWTAKVDPENLFALFALTAGTAQIVFALINT